MMEPEEEPMEAAPEADRDVENLGGENATAKGAEMAKGSPFFRSRKRIFLTLAAVAVVAVVVTVPTVLLTNDSSSKTPETSPDDIPDGVWTSRGWGYVIDVADGEWTWMEETAISCILVLRQPADGDSLSQYFGDILLDDDGDVATFTQDPRLSPVVFDKVDASQGACANGLTLVAGDAGYVRDPLLDFDVLAKTFDERYASFELRGINWDGLTAAARKNLTSNSTDDELVEAFASILLPLDDYHVILLDEAGNFLVQSKPWVFAQFKEEFEQQEDMNISDVDSYQQIQLEKWFQIVGTYMNGGLNGLPGDLGWGRFNGTGKQVGYMQVVHLDPEDKDAFTAKLEGAFLSLADTESLVLDIRLNRGGYKDLVLLVASHFVSERMLAWTERIVDDDGYTDPFEVYMEPGSGPTYDGEVIVIISGSTVSAGEYVAMTMAQLPQTTLLGRNTAGATSGAPDRRLPNGWIFTVSQAEVVSPDGVIYEVVGIPPDILPDADLLPLSEREAGIDSWLELALLMAKQ